jgi:hypothetical protein
MTTDKLHADKGYDYPRCRRYLHQRGIKVRIARCRYCCIFRLYSLRCYVTLLV